MEAGAKNSSCLPPAKCDHGKGGGAALPLRNSDLVCVRLVSRVTQSPRTSFWWAPQTLVTGMRTQLLPTSLNPFLHRLLTSGFLMHLPKIR